MSKHIFISYSRSNLDMVQHITNDLLNAGINVWIDKVGLKPGTPDWEQALRDAIHNAEVVLFMASPTARRSPYVRDELAIADMERVAVYPVWVEGEHWMDCIPMGRGYVQFIDVRGGAYHNGLQQIANALTGKVVKFETQETPVAPEPVEVNAGDTNQSPRNPYKGLRAFRAEDEQDFFGRDTLINELIAILGTGTEPPRLLAVLGASGSGKSSVVMAGLLPRLQQGVIRGSENWLYLDPIVPGAYPIESLTIALRRYLPNTSQKAIREDLLDRNKRGLHTLTRELSEKPVVLYIDQFEELFTLVNEESERRQFIDLLTTAITEPQGSLIVLLSMRADFYDRPAQYQEFGALIEENHVLAKPMSLADLYDVVQKPAQLSEVNLTFDDGLVTELVFAVREEVAALPLLQFTLEQLFEKRDKRRLTLLAYQSIGGVQGALAQHAEATYQALPSQKHKALARALFLRLIEAGATEQDTTRRRATTSELTLPDAENTRILQDTANAFVDARLLVSDKSNNERTIEVSHEALIREWQRLGGWLREAREDLRLQKSISADVEEWRRRKQPSDMLYRGTVLQEALAWGERNTPSRDETLFLHESEKAETARKQSAEQQQTNLERMQRRARNSVLIIIAAGVVLIVVSALGFLAFQQSLAAREAEVIALDAQQTAIVQVTDVAQAQANAENNLVTAEAAATEVAQIAVIAVDAQQTAILQLTDIAQAQINAENNLVTAEAAGTEAALQAANASTQQALAELAAANAVNAQGRVEESLIEANALGTQAAENLVTAEAAGTLAAEQAAIASTQQVRAEVAAAEAAENAAASRSLALAGSANDLLAQNSPLALLLAMEANRGLSEEQVSPLSRRVLSLAAFSAPRQRFAADAPVTSVIFLPFEGVSPDNNPIPPGLQAVSGTADGRIMLWDVREGSSQTFEGGHTSRINEIVLNPANPNMMASVGNDGVGIIWSISDGIAARRLVSGSSNVPANTIAFNTEGTSVAIGYADGNIVIFDTNGSQIMQLPQVSANAVNSIVFRPDTSNDMVIAYDDATRYWDAGLSIFIPFDLGNILARMNKIQAVAFSDDADAVLTSNSAPLFFLSEVFFGADSVLTSQSDMGNRPQLWSIDVDNFAREDNKVQPLRITYPDHIGVVTDVTYSPNGDFIVSTATDGTVYLVDADSGLLVRRLLAHEASVWDAAFSSDGRFILTGGADNVMYLWDFNTNIGNEETYDSVGEGDVINASVSQVHFTEDGRIFSGSDRGEVALWSFENYTPEFSMPLVQSEVPQVVYRVLETIDETTGEPVLRLLSGSLDMRLYDMTSSEMLASYNREEETAFVNDIAITRDGRFAAWAGGYFQRILERDALNYDVRIPILTLWDTQTGAVVRNFDVQSLQSEVAATPSSTSDAATASDATTEDSNQQVDNSITAVAIYPDSTKIVTGDEFGRIIIWDLNTGERLTELEGHTDIISVLRFNDDGTQLLSASADRIIILWRIDTDVTRSFQQRRFIGHTDYINDIDFSPIDAENAATINTIVSGSEDRRVIQWDATTGEILQILAEQSGPITSVKFTPDGDGVVFGTLDGRVVYKGIDSPEAIIAWSENNRYVPQLTCPQAEQYNIAVEGCMGDF
jgi:WD40 repeat protein